MQDALLQAGTRWAAADAVTAVALLLLAAVRWFGFLWAAPLPGRSAVPVRTRLGLALLLAVLVLPALAGRSFDEPPPAGGRQLDAALAPVVNGFATSSTSNQSPAAPVLLSLGLLAGGELLLGLVLAFGMRIVLAGIQLAGALIDQQAGIALAEIFNPALNGRTTPTGDWLVWVAVAVFLAAPLNGDLAATALMLDLFQALPVAGSPHLAPAQTLVMVLVQQSLVLSLRLALPLLAVMSLVSIATAWASRAGRPLMLWPGMIPLRIALSLVLLTVGAAGSADLLAARFAGWIDGVRALLIG